MNLDAARFIKDAPGSTYAAELLGDRKTGLQTIFMEARAEIGAAEPSRPAPLERPEFILPRDRLRVEDRVMKRSALDHAFVARLKMKVERNEARRRLGNALQSVHPIGCRKGR